MMAKRLARRNAERNHRELLRNLRLNWASNRSTEPTATIAEGIA
jgi:hypothetical protein